MWWIYGTIIAIVIVFLLFYFVGVYFDSVAFNPKRYTSEETIKIESDKGFMEGYQETKREDYLINSFDGYVLHTTLIKAEKETKKIVIISHGHTYTKYGSVKYAMLYRKLGYDSIIYDNRGHGENKRCSITMGEKEAKDLMEVIKDTYKRYGDNIYLGLHGESLGSALSLIALKYKPNVKFVVSDCAFSNLDVLFRDMIKRIYHLPKFLVDFASLAAKINYHLNIKKISPIDSLTDNMVPVCFINGDKDDLMSLDMVDSMYQRNKGYKEMHIFEGARHAESYGVDKKRYLEILTAFLDKAEEINEGKK
ncbi:MAG: alpha/beta hydrolase [Bacillales bacterium]|nr:alpha/beta hydrolase [Bacillales bacterium]